MSRKAWIHYARKAIEVGGQVADVAVHLTSNPSPIGIASAGVKLLSSAMSMAPQRGPVDGWNHIDLGEIGVQVYAELGGSGALRHVFTGSDDQQCFEWRFGTHSVRWSSHSGNIHGPYVVSDSDAVMDGLRDLLWSMVDGRGLLLVQRRDWRDSITFVRDEVGASRESATADSLWARVRPLVEAGIPTAALLHGPPGTGKSCIASRIAAVAGGRCMRLHTCGLFSKGAPKLVDFLRPDVVVIDDIDRAIGESTMEQIDEIKARSKIVLASANITKKIDPALLRPGRFDEVVRIDSLDPSVFDRVLAGVPEEDAERLRQLPIAYSTRYMNLRRSVGADVATAEIAALEERHQMIMKQQEKDPG